MTKKQQIGIFILRLSLAFVFLWFGFSQLSNAALWISFVPEWATRFLSSGALVYLNGLFEIALGIMLAFGVLTRYVALILGLHLFVIAGSMGFSAIGVRDFGLSLVTISLFFLGNDQFSWSFRKTQNAI